MKRKSFFFFFPFISFVKVNIVVVYYVIVRRKVKTEDEQNLNQILKTHQNHITGFKYRIFGFLFLLIVAHHFDLR